ncbi:MAG: hypothetical protein WC444_05765 [Candidatus Paceibacterota bacterium]
MTTQKPKVVIQVQGGCVCAVESTEPIDYIIIDEDIGEDPVGLNTTESNSISEEDFEKMSDTGIHI